MHSGTNNTEDESVHIALVYTRYVHSYGFYNGLVMMGELKSHGALFAQSQVLRWRHVSLTVILYHHHLPCETIEFVECRVQFTFCSNKKLQLCIESVYHREKGQQRCDTQAMRRASRVSELMRYDQV